MEGWVDSIMFRIIIILLFLISLINEQQKEIIESNPCEQAVIDAQNDVDKWLWIQTGLAARLFSNKLAKSLIQNPEIKNLLNMPEDYINEYNDCYKEEVKRLRISYARKGYASYCIIAAGVTYIAMNLDYIDYKDLKNKNYEK